MYLRDSARWAELGRAVEDKDQDEQDSRNGKGDLEFCALAGVDIQRDRECAAAARESLEDVVRNDGGAACGEEQGGALADDTADG